jgi:hypothetical protein
MEQMMAVNNSWLDSNIDNSWGQPLTTSCAPITNYPIYYYYSTMYVAKPIRLTMSEVESLRKVAKSDSKLKDILAKFTSQIEVIVDFS